MSDGCILIPARYGSSRFPGKPLAKIQGQELIEWVRKACEKNAHGWPVYVVTDDDRIEDCVKSGGGAVLRVDDDLPSGSDRIYAAFERHLKDQNLKFILNVQGDEPLLEIDSIDSLIQMARNENFDVLTLLHKRERCEKDFTDRNKVKVIYTPDNKKCHYFSREPIPHDQQEETCWYQHIGLYLYQKEALSKFVESSVGHYEKSERLEQLRFLEIGLTIKAQEVEKAWTGVDTPEDLKKVEEKLGGQ